MAPVPPADVVLILAPVGADGANLHHVLLAAGLSPRICRGEAEFRQACAGPVGAIVLTEEAAAGEFDPGLDDFFGSQPPWSDIPVLLIASGGPNGLGPAMAARLGGPGRTVTFLERPLRTLTLLAALNTLLVARHRQYEIRDLLHERDALLASLESRVAERTAELQSLVEEMEAFSYSVSHDLRSPLRSLAGYADALREDYAETLPAGARTYCERISRAAERMDHLTQDVLAYTRVARGHIEIVPVDLDRLVADVIEQYPGFAAAEIRIRRPLGHVWGHVPSLIQCFSNLFGNAIKFVPAGRQPVVEVWSRPVGEDRCRIFVRDNGVGIDPQDQERIFRMFERATGNDVPGTGIGLAIVRKAAERMGGSVGVTSRQGSGAEFWIELSAGVSPPARSRRPDPVQVSCA